MTCFRSCLTISTSVWLLIIMNMSDIISGLTPKTFKVFTCKFCFQIYICLLSAIIATNSGKKSFLQVSCPCHRATSSKSYFILQNHGFSDNIHRNCMYHCHSPSLSTSTLKPPRPAVSSRWVRPSPMFYYIEI